MLNNSLTHPSIVSLISTVIFFIYNILFFIFFYIDTILSHPSNV